jgi:hypothetical protein
MGREETMTAGGKVQGGKALYEEVEIREIHI